VPGRFITFEGLDGCGKSTQLRLAARRLEDLGLDPLVTHEPGGTELGERLRSAFLDPQWSELDGTVEALVVFASRRQHLLEVIRPALEADRLVLCDRFTDSTRAYQGHGRGLAADRISTLDALATGGLDPDLTLLFDLPAEIARSRGHGGERLAAGESDRLDQEQLDFYQRVREGYLEIAGREPDRFRVLDASGGIDETRELVAAALDEFLGVAA
jgi:dTMP kinase